MKKIQTALLLLFFAAASLYAQNNIESSLKNNLTQLFSFSKEKSFDKAAVLIAYSGEDQNRNMKAHFDPSNKDEINQVKRVCKKISALLDLSSKYDFGKFENKKTDSSELYLLDVTFLSGDQKLTTTFTFVKTNSGYLLLNVN